MPRGRILLKSISQSMKLPRLKTDSARLLYTWLLSHLDINGCFFADAVTVNSLVFTRLNKTEKQIEEWLQDLEFNKLIIRFQDNGDDYLFVPDFVDKQPSLRADHEGKPYIKDFTPTKLQPSSNPTPTFVRTSKVKESKVKQSKDDFFNRFWKAYPYKKSKGQAEKAFEKIKPDAELFDEIIKGLDRAKKSQKWAKDNGEFIPYPATWLNARGWEDEDVEIGETQGTTMECKKCGDSGQYAGIDENGVCTKCRLKKE